jgi:hypothetical protein
MTSFWLFLSDLFKFLSGFMICRKRNELDSFFVAKLFFCYWCYVLVAVLGNNKDKDYHSPTEGKFHTIIQNYTLKKINQIS